MSESNKGLFFMIMEADGDEIEPFDDTGGSDAGADTGGDIPSEDIAPPATEDDSGGGDDMPPEMNDTGMDGMPDMNDGGGGDTGGFGDDSSDSSGDSNDNDDADKKDDSLSEKANNILNQRLYQRMVDRNKEIEEIIKNIQTLVPLLPFETVKQNDGYINQLKTALVKGQKYAVDDFINAGYGENLLFYQKLDSLYALLLNRIDTNLKKIRKQ